MAKTRQEEACEYIGDIFIKLIQENKKLSYEYKRSLMAFMGDIITDENVKNDMLQAMSNFLNEIDKKLDSARKAGIIEVKESINRLVSSRGVDFKYISVATVRLSCDLLIERENTPEEEPLTTDEIADMDLREVGGGDEDDSPII